MKAGSRSPERGRFFDALGHQEGRVLGLFLGRYYVEWHRFAVDTRGSFSGSQTSGTPNEIYSCPAIPPKSARGDKIDIKESPDTAWW
jgi:hypothetical protein